MSSSDLSVIIKTQKAFIKELLKMLVGKDKSEICLKTIEEKFGKVCNRYFQYPKSSYDDNCVYFPIHNDFFSVRELKDLFNQDDYFNGLTLEQILELAKKSIRITAENRRLEDKIEKIIEMSRDVKSAFENSKAFLDADKVLELLEDKENGKS